MYEIKISEREKETKENFISIRPINAKRIQMERAAFKTLKHSLHNQI